MFLNLNVHVKENCCKTCTLTHEKLVKWKDRRKKYRMRRWEWFKCNHIITRKIEAENETRQNACAQHSLPFFSFALPFFRSVLYQRSFAKRQPRNCVCVCMFDVQFFFTSPLSLILILVLFHHLHFPNESHCIIVSTFAITTNSTTTATATGNNNKERVHDFS